MQHREPRAHRALPALPPVRRARAAGATRGWGGDAGGRGGPGRVPERSHKSPLAPGRPAADSRGPVLPYLLSLSTKARRSALGRVAMRRAGLDGLGARGAEEGRGPDGQPLQRPPDRPPASSVSRAGKLPHFHLGRAAPGGGLCTAAHGAAGPGTHRALGEGVDAARNSAPDAPSRRPQARASRR